MFPAVDLARQAGETGGCMTAVYNAANEEAAEAFLAGRIRFPRSWEPSPTCCTPPTNGRLNRLPWKTYLKPSAGPGGRATRTSIEVVNAQEVAEILSGDDVRYRHCAVRPGHPGLGGAARMRPHVGGPRHRDEGPPLLRRLRSHAVVDQRPSGWATEYGVKAVPLGGFCDIAGMTPVEELTPRRDEPRAMYKQEVWKRVAVLFAGPAMNFVIGLVLIYGIALVWGLPQPAPADHGGRRRNRLRRSRKSPRTSSGTAPVPVRPRWPASAPATSWSRSATPRCRPSTEMVAAVRKMHGTVPVVVDRGRHHDHRHYRRRHAHPALPPSGEGRAVNRPVRRSAPSASPPPKLAPTHYSVLSAVPATFAFTGELSVRGGQVAGHDPDQGGCAGARHRRRRA